MIPQKTKFPVHDRGPWALWVVKNCSDPKKTYEDQGGFQYFLSVYKQNEETAKKEIGTDFTISERGLRDVFEWYRFSKSNCKIRLPEPRFRLRDSTDCKDPLELPVRGEAEGRASQDPLYRSLV